MYVVKYLDPPSRTERNWFLLCRRVIERVSDGLIRETDFWNLSLGGPRVKEVGMFVRPQKFRDKWSTTAPFPTRARDRPVESVLNSTETHALGIHGVVTIVECINEYPVYSTLTLS